MCLGDAGIFRYQESSGCVGALSVVFFHVGEGRVSSVSTEAGHRGHGNSVFELELAELQRLEELCVGHGDKRRGL